MKTSTVGEINAALFEAERTIGQARGALGNGDSATALSRANRALATLQRAIKDIQPAEHRKFRVIDLESDELRGVYDTLEEARGCVAYDRLRAYAIWHNGVMVEVCDPHRGDDDRAKQGLGEIPTWTRKLSCGCCTNGCCCFMHRDVPNGRPAQVCEFHSKSGRIEKLKRQ
jgi:hypothetical protein